MSDSAVGESRTVLGDAGVRIADAGGRLGASSASLDALYATIGDTRVTLDVVGLAAEAAHAPLGVVNGAPGVGKATLDESHDSDLQSNAARGGSLATRATGQSP